MKNELKLYTWDYIGKEVKLNGETGKITNLAGSHQFVVCFENAKQYIDYKDIDKLLV